VQGVGVQFKDDESGTLVRSRIESLLSGQLQLNRPTHAL
jgi:Tfp pilus assembly protein PilZ